MLTGQLTTLSVSGVDIIYSKLLNQRAILYFTHDINKRARRNAENTVPLVMAETTFLKSEALVWEWIRNPLNHECEHASFKLLRRRLGLKPSSPLRKAITCCYSQVANIDWDSCSKVLDAGDRRKLLMGGW